MCPVPGPHSQREPDTRGSSKVFHQVSSGCPGHFLWPSSLGSQYHCHGPPGGDIPFQIPLQPRSPNLLAPGTGFVSWKTIFPWTGGGGWDGSGGNGSDGERWGEADEASLARLPLTSCCTARFLTGRGPAPVRGPGVGNPCSTAPILKTNLFPKAEATGRPNAHFPLLKRERILDQATGLSGHSWTLG